MGFFIFLNFVFLVAGCIFVYNCFKSRDEKQKEFELSVTNALEEISLALSFLGENEVEKENKEIDIYKEINELKDLVKARKNKEKVISTLKKEIPSKRRDRVSFK